MSSAPKRASWTVAGALPAGLLARPGMPVLATLVFLGVLVLGVACWIIGSHDRSERVTRLLLARRGDPACLAQGPSAPAVFESRQPVDDMSGATTPAVPDIRDESSRCSS